jgi:hypothetical protein
MTTTSGFTFIHNALESGYPIVEAIRAVQPYVDEVVVVDMASTDGTRDLLERMGMQQVYDVARNHTVPLKILDGEWGNAAGETLRLAHSQYIECAGDVIVHFEADEVFENRLIRSVMGYIKAGVPETTNLAIHRLQIEQNFQRCRWYPEPVHRVFPRTGGAKKEGHTTDQHDKAFVLMPKNGYLWDCTNCFRDNWFRRVEKQAELRGAEPQYVMVPLHALQDAELSEAEAQFGIYGAKHWAWIETPFAIPEILRPLLGMVKYEPSI